MRDLVSETRRLAKASKMPVDELCAAAKVKRRWFYRFLAGDFKEPGVGKISRLYTVLTEVSKRAA